MRCFASPVLLGTVPPNDAWCEVMEALPTGAGPLRRRAVARAWCIYAMRSEAELSRGAGTLRASSSEGRALVPVPPTSEARQRRCSGHGVLNPPKPNTGAASLDRGHGPRAVAIPRTGITAKLLPQNYYRKTTTAKLLPQNYYRRNYCRKAYVR